MILICPDSFKDAISSLEACRAMARGIKSFAPGLNYKIFPVSDGGEGFVDVLDYHLNLAHIPCNTTDPLQRPIETRILFDKLNKRSFFAMSQAAGLELLSANERNPVHTSTYGVGRMIQTCVDAGAKEIMIGVGGSATNDGGTGMATALGWQFLDRNGNSLSGVGKDLSAITEIIPPKDNYLAGVNITLLCDVNNPLLGKAGATYTFGRQKGASKDELAVLEAGMHNLNSLIQNHLGKDLASDSYTGAAGGFGAGAVAFLDASLVSGVKKMIEMTDLQQHIDNAGLVLTGEGKLDAQTASGKLIHGIASICQKARVPVVAFCGQVDADSDDLAAIGLYRAIIISEGVEDIVEAIRNSSELLERSVADELPQILCELEIIENKY